MHNRGTRRVAATSLSYFIGEYVSLNYWNFKPPNNCSLATMISRRSLIGLRPSSLHWKKTWCWKHAIDRRFPNCTSSTNCPETLIEIRNFFDDLFFSMVVFFSWKLPFNMKSISILSNAHNLQKPSANGNFDFYSFYRTLLTSHFSLKFETKNTIIYKNCCSQFLMLKTTGWIPII